MSKEKLKSYSLEEMEDKYIGKIGTPARDKYEYKLHIEISRRLAKFRKTSHHEKEGRKKDIG
jgi:hypothetical protein